MTPGALLEALTARDVSLRLVDGILKYKAPKGVYTAKTRGAVAVHKQEFIMHWRCAACGRIESTLYGLKADQLKCRPCAVGKGLPA